jgi:hypothetical protein
VEQVTASDGTVTSQGYVKFYAYSQVETSPKDEAEASTRGIPNVYYTLSFGGVRNPRTALPTGVFTVETRDVAHNLVAIGPLDIIRMTEMSKFNELAITAADG